MSKMDVSIIMPIYNAGDYLKKSLDSAVNQTLRNIEIICVNDGSTDGSLAVMKEYAKNDERIKVVDKPNGGYGHAMNRGLEQAEGEYIAILEPDDYYETTLCEVLYQSALEHDADMVKANYYELQTVDGEEQNNFMEVLWGLPYNTVFSAQIHEEAIVRRPSIWSGIYRRQFLVDNNISFHETPGAAYQDTTFAFKVWVSAKRVFLLKDAYLHYRLDNENSSVNSSGKIFCICDELHGMEDFLNDKEERKKNFSKILQVLKYDSYRWNLDRVADDYKEIFRDMFAIEFARADMEGLLDKSKFSDVQWNDVQNFLGYYRRKCKVYHTVKKVRHPFSK